MPSEAKDDSKSYIHVLTGHNRADGISNDRRIKVQIGHVVTGVPKGEEWISGDGIFFGEDPKFCPEYGTSLIEVPFVESLARCYRATMIPEEVVHRFADQVDILTWLARVGLKSNEMLVVDPTYFELNLRSRDELAIVAQFSAIRELADRFPLAPPEEVDEDDPTD